MIIFKMDSIIAIKSIGTSFPASVFIRKGVITGDTSVEQEVIVTDRATLPPAIKVIRFEATPPGHDPMRMTPAATSGSKPKRVAIAKPAKGMMLNCKTSPMNTGHGILATRVKSPVLSVVPMPNIMIWMSGTMRTPRSKPNQLPNARG